MSEKASEMVSDFLSAREAFNKPGRVIRGTPEGKCICPHCEVVNPEVEKDIKISLVGDTYDWYTCKSCGGRFAFKAGMTRWFVAKAVGTPPQKKEEVDQPAEVQEA